jgi:hypothetical protein
MIGGSGVAEALPSSSTGIPVHVGLGLIRSTALMTNGATVAVGADSAAAVPVWPVAVTRSLSVEPTSMRVSA